MYKYTYIDISQEKKHFGAPGFKTQTFQLMFTGITRSMSFIYLQPVFLRTSELPLNNWHGHLHLHIWSFFLPLSWLLFLVEAPSLREESTKSKTAQAPALPVSVSAGVSGVEATKRAAAGSALVTKKPSGSTSKGHIFCYYAAQWIFRHRQLGLWMAR